VAAATRVLISEANPGEGDVLREILGRTGMFEVVAYAQDGLEAAQLSFRLRPDVALIWEDLVGLRGPEACELVSRTAPDVACVMIARAAGEESRRLAMMAGARAIIGAGELDELPGLILRLLQVRREMPLSALSSITEAQRAPLVIMVTGARGGIGKTTVAVNMAVHLAQGEREKVVLLEAPGQLGDGSIFLDLVSASSFLSLVQMPALDHDVVMSALAHHSSGVSFLPATSDQPAAELSQFDRATTAAASSLLGMLKRSHSVVVVDCPPHLWPLASYLARRSHMVVLLASPEDLIAVRNAATLTDLLRSAGVGPERLMPVINRATSGGLLKPDDVAKAAGWTDYFAIPTDNTNCSAAVNEGVPLMARTPASPAARAISQLADRLLQRGRALAGGAQQSSD